MGCEAMIPVGRTWTMCGREPADLHHKITRARGGLILDQHGETYHQMRLCREHHGIAHDKPAFKTGLLIDGFITTCTRCREPKYEGTDLYLTEHYGAREVHVQCVRAGLRGADSGEVLRGEA